MISSVGIVYPPTAKQSSIQGSVTVSATVNESGKVVSATAVSGPLLLRQAAVDSVKQWKYLPGTVDGKPTTAQVNVRVDFHLN
jgi:protein TonB